MKPSKAVIYNDPNLHAARLILADPQRYGGEDAGLVRWARMTLERLKGKA